MKNQIVADTFYLIADLLDLKGEIFFKSRAYRMAAQTIEALDEDIEIVAKEQRLESIPGIGEAIAKKIVEIIETGKLRYVDSLKKEVPEGLIDILRVPGLGPKKVAALYKNLKITSLSQLREAAAQGKIRHLEGFGELTEQNILRGIQLLEKTSGRALINVAYADGMRYIEYLNHCRHIKHVSLAGSLRRMKETIGDIDILASSKKPKDVMTYFVNYPDVVEILAQGPTKSSVLLHDHIQVDLRVVEQKSYGAALQYFSGSKEHNVVLRGIASRKGYKLNEYGLFKKKTDTYVAGKTEQEVYKKLGFPYFEPELRENHGEFEAATKHTLPVPVGYDEIHGDFHVHSHWSDGADSVETLAQTAQHLGYTFLGITDHSQGLKIANGLSEDRVLKKMKDIERVNKKYPEITLLCGTECDIKADGTLDYPDSLLKRFDFVYIAIHTAFKMDKQTMTRRITKGMQNEHVDFLAHPTGRLIGKREPYEVDIEQVIDTAKETDTFLEINSFPDRLDLNDMHAKQVKDHGVKTVIGTDSHSMHHLEYIKFGIATARRGWQEKKDVLNTYSLKDINNILER